MGTAAFRIDDCSELEKNLPDTLMIVHNRSQGTDETIIGSPESYSNGSVNFSEALRVGLDGSYFLDGVMDLYSHASNNKRLGPDYYVVDGTRFKDITLYRMEEVRSEPSE
jgi:hypothetical protein